MATETHLQSLLPSCLEALSSIYNLRPTLPWWLGPTCGCCYSAYLEAFSSIYNLRMRHAIVTGTHLSWLETCSWFRFYIEDYSCAAWDLLYEGKSLNNRNAIPKCMKNYAQGKILFRDTKWLLSSMSYRGCDDQAVWACALGRTTWLLHCQLALWKINEALFVFVARGCETFWNLQNNEGAVWRQLFESGENVWMGGKIL